MIRLLFKGIVSRKFDVLFWYHLKAWKFLNLFILSFFKISSFSCRIFEYSTFRGEFLLVTILLTHCAT
jgi:hypothetical protein